MSDSFGGFIGKLKYLMSRTSVYCQAILLCYVVVTVVVFILEWVIPSFPPNSIADFVVDKNSELLLFGDFNNTLYIYSPDLEIKKSFDIAQGGEAHLVVGEDDNVYISRGSYLFVYDMNGVMKMTTGYERYSNWRLNAEDKVEHFISSAGVSRDMLYTKRLRRVAKPGDILYYRIGLAAPANIEDPFIDTKGNRYVSRGWFYGIKVYNPKGELIKELKPPLLLRPFIWFFPGGYLLAGKGKRGQARMALV